MTTNGETGDLIATLRIAGHGDHEMRGPVTIGRDPRADGGATIDVDGDPLVSKSHLCIDVDQADLIITDLGSSNGTFLHHAAGETAVPSDRWIPVPAGAEIEFGDQRMTIERAPVPIPDASTSATLTPDAATAADGVPCAQCHRDLPPGSKFCDSCGAPVMPESTPVPSADDAGRTVVIPPGGFVPGPGHPAASPAGLPVPGPQYGGPVAGPAPQGPPPGHYGQSPLPPGSVPPGPVFLGATGQPAGGPVFVDPSAATSSKGGAGKKILLGAAVLVVLGLIGVALVTVLGGGDDSAGGLELELTPVSTEIDELWSTGVDDAVGFVEIGETSVYVESDIVDAAMLTSLERETGDERWERTFDDADFVGFVGEFGDITVVSACVVGDDGPTTCDAIGLDRTEGDEIWRESIDDGSAFATPSGVTVFADDGLALLDPATGGRVERVRGEVAFGDRNAYLLSDDGDVSAYDGDLQPLIGPLRVDDDAVAVTFDGDRLLVSIGDEIEFVDATGDVTSGPRLDGDITRLVSIDSSTLIAELGDEVVAYDLDGEDAVERWSESGTLSQFVDPDGGTVVIVESDDETSIIDLESGDDRFDVGNDSGLITASNALVAFEESSSERFTAYEWATGDEIWSEEFDGSGNVDGILVVIETDGDVVAYG